MMTLILSSVLAVMLAGCGKDKDISEEVPSTREESVEEEAVEENRDLLDDFANAVVDEESRDDFLNEMADEIGERMETYREESLEEAEAAQPAKEASANESIFAEINDNVIYDEDGVLFTIESISKDGEVVLSLKNDNPDNKKVEINNIGIYLNGFRNQYALIRYQIISGESEQIHIVCSLDRYRDIMAKLDCADMKVETMGFSFDLQIGSDSVFFNTGKTLQTSAYNETDMDQLYGEYVSSVEISDLGTVIPIPIDIYFKETSSHSIAAVLVNRGDHTIGLNAHFSANGKGLKR